MPDPTRRPRLLARVTRRGTQAQIRHVPVVPPHAARGLVARVYAQLEHDFGMLAPPVALHAPAPGTLAACWTMLRETLVVSGAADRTAKEVVAAAVSGANACPYCVEVHGTMLYGLAGGRLAGAVRDGRFEAIGDPGLRAVAAWARGSGAVDGAAAPLPAGLGERQAAQLVGVAVTFHYLNRMVNVFLPDSPLPPGLPAAVRGGLRRAAGRLLRPAPRPPGASLDLLPPAPLPADLAWAAADPDVAGAFARAAAAVEEAGRRSVPDAVRALVRDALAGRAGRPDGPSRGWAEEAVSGLPDRDRPAGLLALLTAMASYQVGPSVIDGCRRAGAGDAELVELASWAALAAARRAGRSLGQDPPAPVRGAAGDRPAP
jgi:alkylhydroperoxidase family enzyme